MRDVLSNRASINHAITRGNVVVTRRRRTSCRGGIFPRHLSARLLPRVVVILVFVLLRTVRVRPFRAVTSRRTRPSRLFAPQKPRRYRSPFYQTIQSIVVGMFRAHRGDHRRVRRRVRDQRPPIRRTLPILTHPEHSHDHPNVTPDILFVRHVARSNRANYALNRAAARLFATGTGTIQRLQRLRDTPRRRFLRSSVSLRRIFDSKTKTRSNLYSCCCCYSWYPLRRSVRSRGMMCDSVVPPPFPTPRTGVVDTRRPEGRVRLSRTRVVRANIASTRALFPTSRE